MRLSLALEIPISGVGRFSSAALVDQFEPVDVSTAFAFERFFNFKIFGVVLMTRVADEKIRRIVFPCKSPHK